MKTITKVKQFISTKSILELILITYCAILSVIFVTAVLSVLYALIFDQSLLNEANFGYLEGVSNDENRSNRRSITFHGNYYAK